MSGQSQDLAARVAALEAKVANLVAWYEWAAPFLEDVNDLHIPALKEDGQRLDRLERRQVRR